MERIRKREGLICVCAECKNVIRVVGKVSPRVLPRISHGICPACAERLYGSIFRGERRQQPAGGPGSGGTVRPPSSAAAG